MIKVTLDNGLIIMYESFLGVIVHHFDEADVSVLAIQGSVKPGQEFTNDLKQDIINGFPEDGPFAIRTIEFLP